MLDMEHITQKIYLRIHFTLFSLRKYHHVKSFSRMFSWNWFHGNSQILYFQISTCVTVLFMVSLYFLRQQWVCVSNLKVSRFNRYSVILIFGFFFQSGDCTRSSRSPCCLDVRWAAFQHRWAHNSFYRS